MYFHRGLEEPDGKPSTDTASAASAKPCRFKASLAKAPYMGPIQKLMLWVKLPI